MKKMMGPLLLLIALVILSACSRQAENVPEDFYLMMDVRDKDRQTAKNVNLRIHANGKVEYDIYATGGVIHYDENDRVRYGKNQIIQEGRFSLTPDQMEILWQTINRTRFFELADKYQMQIGYSYAFILIEANGQEQMVDNIGMEVPEMRALVEMVAALMPYDINIEYGEGFKP